MENKSNVYISKNLEEFIAQLQIEEIEIDNKLVNLVEGFEISSKLYEELCQTEGYQQELSTYIMNKLKTDSFVFEELVHQTNMYALDEFPFGWDFVLYNYDDLYLSAIEDSYMVAYNDIEGTMCTVEEFIADVVKMGYDKDMATVFYEDGWSLSDIQKATERWSVPIISDCFDGRDALDLIHGYFISGSVNGHEIESVVRDDQMNIYAAENDLEHYANDKEAAEQAEQDGVPIAWDLVAYTEDVLGQESYLLNNRENILAFCELYEKTKNTSITYDFDER